ncbi:hypothetical protein BGP_3791 [Beggiatoa sp. PS]|nr:hypothetical protein BGP_3791 [Beggiatoa sp. PS]
MRIAKLETVSQAELQQLKNTEEECAFLRDSQVSIQPETLADSNEKKCLPVVQKVTDIFDKQSLHTLSADSNLKVINQIPIPANTDSIYIQDGKIINENNVDGTTDFHCVVHLKKSPYAKLIESGTNIKVIDSSEHGPEDRIHRHTYVYLKLEHNDILSLKCLGINNLDYISIGEFKKVAGNIFEINMPLQNIPKK